MYDVGESLRAADATAHAALQAAQLAVARSGAGAAAGRSADAAMANTAQAAIFSEALLGVEHARFEALQAVTR
ncbi:MAG TPA: hypothetical protein VMF61_02350 [Candidatus Acidoferrales bacterium]|nr:hypothetical protein [Candidatus Acidoferrales bacterium]